LLYSIYSIIVGRVWSINTRGSPICNSIIPQSQLATPMPTYVPDQPEGKFYIEQVQQETGESSNRGWTSSKANRQQLPVSFNIHKKLEGMAVSDHYQDQEGNNASQPFTAIGIDSSHTNDPLSHSRTVNIDAPCTPDLDGSEWTQGPSSSEVLWRAWHILPPALRAG
jgi:hypothetical protein